MRVRAVTDDAEGFTTRSNFITPKDYLTPKSVTWGRPHVTK